MGALGPRLSARSIDSSVSILGADTKFLPVFLAPTALPSHAFLTDPL